MNTNKQGNIAESIALSHYLSEGYEVFIPFGTASTCDMIILKDGISKRVSVKSCNSEPRNGYYQVRIRQKKKKDIPFDHSTSDILFIYLLGPKRIHIIETKNVKTKYEIWLNVN